MRITATDEYVSHKIIGTCPYLSETCDRQYCRAHRTLYRFCETAVKTHDGAGETFYEWRECPECLAQERMVRYV